jgi:hypothetical protein
MVNFFAVCGCCTRTDIVREHLEDTVRICDVSAMGLLWFLSLGNVELCLRWYVGLVATAGFGSDVWRNFVSEHVLL